MNKINKRRPKWVPFGTWILKICVLTDEIEV